MLKLYDYQKRYLSKAKPNYIYDCDCGVGKTVMSLAHYRIHFKEKPLCIVAPASKLKEGGWQRTVELMCPNIKKLKYLSYNVIHKNIEELEDYFIIWDESQKIKNSCGVWGKAAWQICKKAAGYIFLSATPIPNGWEDAINYFKIFGITKNKTHFIRTFGITNLQWGHLEIVGWRNSKTLKEAWGKISHRLNKEDCLDLPELVIKDIHFKPSKEYKKILQTRVLDDQIFDNQMSFRHGLRQNCSTKDKLEYISDLINSTNQNIVIFYNYESELYQLYGLLSNKTIYECNGRRKEFPISNFSEVKNSVTLANYKSGSEGVEFTYADIMVDFSPTESYTEYYQAIHRTYRHGQNNKVTFLRFITEGTIEEAIYQALNNKEDFNFDLWEAKHGYRNKR